MANKWKTVAIIFMILTLVLLVLGISFVYSIALLDLEWQYEYERLDIEWCELSNEHIEIINDLLIELSSYDSDFEDIELIEEVDCYETN